MILLFLIFILVALSKSERRYCCTFMILEESGEAQQITECCPYLHNDIEKCDMWFSENTNNCIEKFYIETS